MIYFHNAIADAIGSTYVSQCAPQDRASANAVLASEEMQAIKLFLRERACERWNAQPRSWLMEHGLPESVARWVMS